MREALRRALMLAAAATAGCSTQHVEVQEPEPVELAAGAVGGVASAALMGTPLILGAVGGAVGQALVVRTKVYSQFPHRVDARRGCRALSDCFAAKR